MSSLAFSSLSPGVDPARTVVLSELDAAVEGLDRATVTLTILREACSWESEGVEALRLALWRLSDDTTGVRAMLWACRREAEEA